MNLRHLPILALLACNLCIADETVSPLTVVDVDGGKISGMMDQGVRNFRGVPYAAPPVGDLRWKAPAPVVGWEGVRACNEFGPVCPQPNYPQGSFYWSEPQEQDEDCLFLNVWTPAKSAGEELPVMVWIHGGAWTRGSGSTPSYNGASLAKRGVVLVTINYRLGPLGFFSHPELSEEGTTGNQGILDSIAALKWVQKNIGKFGGDADRVTIFGESAGSWSVNVLVATPLAKGLFHRAIGESGTRFRSSTLLSEAREGGKSAEQEGVEFASAVGAKSLAELRSLSPEQILGVRFSTHETIDGVTFPDTVTNIFASGKQNRVPAIVGSNADEMTTLSNRATVPKTEEAVTANLLRRSDEKTVAQFKKVYGVKDDASAMRAFLDFGADGSFAVGMRQWARLATESDNDAYLYYFTRVPPAEDSDYRGAYHAAEIMYAFDNVHMTSRIPYGEADRKLADTIASYWVNFAKTGNPNGEGLPEWPKYDLVNEPYIDLGDQVVSKNHLLKERLDFRETVKVRRR